VADTVGGQCTTRLYTFDGGGAGNSNRTGLATYAPTVDGGCQTATAVSTVTSWYDTADRLTTTGTVYDALGRTTLVADADAAGSGDLTGTYYVNDLVRSLAVGTAATTYTPDVDQQRVRSWTDGTTTRTNHYEGDGDAPSWVAEGAASWTRNVGGIGGDLAAIYDSAGTATLQLTNLHGDVIATASTSNVDTAPLSTFESTEYGAGRDAVGRRYAWLGSKQRAADTPGGVSLMGVRVYNPMTGRFLQVDPVYGGNANAYIYPNDPLTDRDLDGRACLVCEGGGARFGGGAALAAWINSLLSGAGSHATVWVYELAGNKFMMQFGSTLIMVSGTSMSGLDAVVDRIHEMAHRKRVPRQQRENPHRTKSNGNAGKGKHEKADGFGPRRRLNNPNKRKDNS
jgi:RHS repeat-associated protein